MLNDFHWSLILHGKFIILVSYWVFSSSMSFGPIVYNCVLLIESKKSFTHHTCVVLSAVLICSLHLTDFALFIISSFFPFAFFAFSFLFSLQQWNVEALCSPCVALSFCPADTIRHIPPCCYSCQSPARKHHGTICFAQKWDIYHCWTPARNREWTGMGSITGAGSHWSAGDGEKRLCGPNGLQVHFESAFQSLLKAGGKLRTLGEDQELKWRSVLLFYYWVKCHPGHIASV